MRGSERSRPMTVQRRLTTATGVGMILVGRPTPSAAVCTSSLTVIFFGPATSMISQPLPSRSTCTSSSPHSPTLSLSPRSDSAVGGKRGRPRPDSSTTRTTSDTWTGCCTPLPFPGRGKMAQCFMPLQRLRTVSSPLPQITDGRTMRQLLKSPCSCRFRISSSAFHLVWWYDDTSLSSKRELSTETCTTRGMASSLHIPSKYFTQFTCTPWKDCSSPCFSSRLMPTRLIRATAPVAASRRSS
mmetsp:Transcript_20303/g.77733  ORF Transcript_20303/g.77733 Transcript_20303/m.77733 type:complete len:242 (+) Transcript_20303:929-1654(+)